jgi:hypothetical protein
MSTMRGECPVPSGSSLYGCTVRFVFHGTKISKEDFVLLLSLDLAFSKENAGYQEEG